MQQYKKHIKLLYMMLLGFEFLFAQTTNTGDVVVSANTQLSVVDSFFNSDLASFINDGETYFYSDFTNNGVVDFISGGLTRFEGEALQFITSNQTSYFFDMLANNNSGLDNAIDLAGSIYVQNNIDLTDGIINTLNNNGEFLLQSGGSVSNTSDISFVDGFITKEGNSSFIFPIGDTNFYRFAGISAPATSTSLIQGRYVLVDPNNNPYPSDFRIGNAIILNPNEYWEIRSDRPEQLEITLSWNENTTPINIFSNPEAIRIARWDFTQNAWREVKDHITDAENKTITARQPIDGLAVFTIAAGRLDILLPDDVVIWNAVSPNGDNINDYFFIEGLEKLPNNKVSIFNRWGDEIFKTSNYDTNGNIFSGFANDRTDKKLPSGTYFYVLSYDASTGERVEKAGYLYLSTD